MGKYSFFKDRLKDIKKTQAGLAQHLNIDKVYINQSINADRELQPKEVVGVARYLEYDIESFTRYFSEELTDYRLIKDAHSTNQKEAILKHIGDIIEEVEKYLMQTNKQITPENKRTVVENLFEETYDLDEDIKNQKISEYARILLNAA